MDYQKHMLALHLKANPREVLVGWYATSAELNTFSALIQNFYGQQGDGTWPFPSIHLTVSTAPGEDIQIQSYISAPVGVTAERAADSCLFIPIPHEIKYGEAEKGGLELVSAAKDKEDRTQGTLSDIETLENAVVQIIGMIEKVSGYVNNVLDEEVAAPSSALGQFLMNALSLAPKVEPADIERDLYVHSSNRRLQLTNVNSNNHLQDVLMVSYLANTIRTQIDLSNRLATAALTLGGGDALLNDNSQRNNTDQRRKARTQNRSTD